MKVLKIIQFLLLSVTFSIGQQTISNVHNIGRESVSTKGPSWRFSGQGFGIEKDLTRLIAGDEKSKIEELLISVKPEKSPRRIIASPLPQRLPAPSQREAD